MNRYQDELATAVVNGIKEDVENKDLAPLTELIELLVVKGAVNEKALEGFLPEETVLSIQKNNAEILALRNTIECSECDTRATTSEAKTGRNDELVCPKCYDWLVSENLIEEEI